MLFKKIDLGGKGREWVLSYSLDDTWIPKVRN